MLTVTIADQTNINGEKAQLFLELCQVKGGGKKN